LILSSQQNGDVVYEVDVSTVSRTQRSNVAEKTHRENYSLQSGSDIQWDKSELPKWITMIVRRSPGVSAQAKSSAADAPVDLRVRVAVGRWLVASSNEANQ
jgi:hypothetical protein